MKKASPINNYSIAINKRTKSISGLVVFIVSFSIYLITTSIHLMSYGDSGELITAAFTKGLPHSPGYPLYMLLGGFITHTPFLSPAYALNIFSALLHAITLVFMYLATVIILEQLITYKDQKKQHQYEIYANAAAIAGSLTLGFSFLFFLYSGIAEVFPLNDFFISLILYLALLFKQNLLKDHIHQALRILVLISICFGLALSNQQIIILLLPPLLFFLIMNMYRKRNNHIPLYIATLSISTILGIVVFFIPYLYIPILLHSHALLTWGHPNTLHDIINEILRKDYVPTGNAIASGQNAYITGVSPTSFLVEIFHYIGFIINHFYWAVLVIAVGIWQLFAYAKRNSYMSFLCKYDTVLFALLSFLFTGPLLASYTALNWSLGTDASLYNDIGIHLRLYLQAEVLLVPFLATGIFAILLFLQNELKKTFATITIYIMSAILPCSLLLVNIGGVDNHNTSLYETIATQTLLSLPKHAILICYTDMLCYSYAYMLYVKHIRSDIVLINEVPSKYKTTLLYHYPHLFSPAFTDDIAILRNIIASNYTNTPIFVSAPSLDQLQSIGAYGNPFYVLPYGYVLQIVKTPTGYSQAQFTYTKKLETTMDTSIRSVSQTTDLRDFSKVGTLSAFTVIKSFIAYLLFTEGYKDDAQTLFSQAASLSPLPLSLSTSLQSYFTNTPVKIPTVVDFTTYESQGMEFLAMHSYTKAQGYFEAAFLLDDTNKDIIHNLLICYKENKLMDQYRQLHQYAKINNLQQ